MSKNFKLSKDLVLNAEDYANQGNAILGIRDAGKTYTAMKAAEQLLDNGIPIIVFDPVGIWKNLKIGIGKHKGYPIVVAGGEGSDIQLTINNAVEIVRAAMKENISLVLDFYCPELINKSTWIRIVQEVVDLLMYENKSYSMRHIFLEEAAEFIPQRLQPQHSRVYASIERLARMGRNARLGITLINQRAEEVNKAILEICAFSLIHKQVGKNSLKSIQQWLELRQLEEVPAIIKSLPVLKQGECWAIGLTDQPKRIHISERVTFHPNPKKETSTAIKMLQADVSGFVTKMQKLLEKPVPMAKSINKNAAATSSPGIDPQKHQVEIDRAIARAQAEVKRQYDNAIKERDNIIGQVKKGLSKLIDDLQKIAALVGVEMQNITIDIPKIDISGIKTDTVVQKSHTSRPVVKSGNINSGAMRMLKAAAMYHPNPITKFRMAAIARLSHSSGSFSTYISLLKREGFLTGEGNLFTATTSGVEQAGDVDPMPTDPKVLIEMWCDIIGNQGGAARMLRVLGENYPEDISKEDLGKEVEMSHTSGSFSTYISTLKRNGLITVKDGWYKASEELFN